LQDIELRRISQEVTKRFYNLLAVHCPRGYCSILFSTENLFVTWTDVQISLPNRRVGDRGAFGECRRSEPASAYQYAHGSRGGAAGVLVPPPMEQSRLGMQITVLMSFKGELFGQPRITFQSREASERERSSYRIAVAQMLKQCASLPFTEAIGNTVAGRPLTMTFVDDREQPSDLSKAGLRQLRRVTRLALLLGGDVVDDL
jgi:hypothetical protein